VTDYQSNSHKSREATKKTEGKKIEPVVTGEVSLKKKSLGQKFKGVFFGGEFKSAVRYVTADVFLPAIRTLLVDATTKGVERVVYGETVTRRRPPQYGPRIQYNTPVRRGVLPDQARPIARQVRHNTNDVVLSSRDEANTVLERLIDIIDKYEVASFADLLELCGLPTSHVDQKWGWTNLNHAEVRQVRDGYMLDLPPAEEI